MEPNKSALNKIGRDISQAITHPFKQKPVKKYTESKTSINQASITQAQATTAQIAKVVFPRCQGHAIHINLEASKILALIEKDTGIEQFIGYCQNYPEYLVWHGTVDGDHALAKAACKGNVDLIYYFVSQGEKKILNFGTCQEWIALHYATLYRHFHAAKALILLGSQINSLACFGETPLSLALGNGCSPKFIRLLLFYGAEMPIPYKGIELRHHSEKSLETVYKIVEIATKTCMNFKLLALGRHDKYSPFRWLPKELVFSIFDRLTMASCGYICQQIFTELKAATSKNRGY